jgi:gliding motility-associated lipoprotein GldD
LPAITGFVAAVFLTGCSSYTPKPHGYPKINYPEKNYKTVATKCPFELTIPTYASLNPDTTTDSCWYNLNFLPFDATLHLTYMGFNSLNELDSLTEDAYTMAMKHTIKATEIREIDQVDTSSGNLIMKYDLFGNTATPFNFYITDGKKHFLRGSFYFNQHTKTDSVEPIYRFIMTDLEKLIANLRWTDNAALPKS